MVFDVGDVVVVVMVICVVVTRRGPGALHGVDEADAGTVIEEEEGEEGDEEDEEEDER